MAIPYDIDVKLGIPITPSEPSCLVDWFSYNGSADNRTQYNIELTGTGYKYLDFGSIQSATGAEFIALKYISSTANPAPPILLRPNATGAIYLPIGGMFLLVSPSPTNGIWRFRVDYTDQATLSVLILG